MTKISVQLTISKAGAIHASPKKNTVSMKITAESLRKGFYKKDY